MGVVFLTQYYPPETGAPQARISEMARCLRDEGFDVQVLAAMPSYPRGRIYDGYRGKVVSVRDEDGIRVVRTALYPTKSLSTLPRLVNYLSFAVSSAVFGALILRRPRVIVCESPPLFLGLSAILLKHRFRARLVFNVSDLWPDSAVQMGLSPPGWGVRLARRLERLCYRASAARTGQSPGIVRELRRRAPSPAVLVPNGCDADLYSPERADSSFRKSQGLEGKIVVGYAGLLGAAQGVGVLLDVAEAMRDDDRVRFLVVGDGPERAEIEARARQLPNVVYAGHAPSERMPGIVASFDLALIPLRYRLPGALPSKVYEAMASKVPIVLAAHDDPRQLVERASAGVVTDYEAEEIAGAVRALVGDPERRASLGANGREYVLRHHQRKVIAERMGRVVDAVARRDHLALRALEEPV